MIVRLKDSIVGFPVITCIMFQFYDSPIKSEYYFDKRAEEISFNSMIVRLKVLLLTSTRSSHFSFQFYDSPIKSLRRTRRTVCGAASFNSMIVRLKECSRGNRLDVPRECFNSMIVRLKVIC